MKGVTLQRFSLFTVVHIKCVLHSDRGRVESDFLPLSLLITPHLESQCTQTTVDLTSLFLPVSVASCFATPSLRRTPWSRWLANAWSWISTRTARGSPRALTPKTSTSVNTGWTRQPTSSPRSQRS